MCAKWTVPFAAPDVCNGSNLPVRSLLLERPLRRVFLPYQERSEESATGSKGSRFRRLSGHDRFWLSGHARNVEIGTYQRRTLGLRLHDP
jgi:hypothetical protein